MKTVTVYQYIYNVHTFRTLTYYLIKDGGIRKSLDKIDKIKDTEMYT